MEIERVLFENSVSSLVFTLFENEKPPRGLAGIIDWHLHGKISEYLKKEIITGQEGECTYFPFQRKGIVFHFILAGSGKSETSGKRKNIPQKTFQVLQKNLLQLKLPKMRISISDFGNISKELLTTQLKGIPLWISP